MPTDIEDEIKDEKNPRPLDEDDIALLKTYQQLMEADAKERPQQQQEQIDDIPSHEELQQMPPENPPRLALGKRSREEGKYIPTPSGSTSTVSFREGEPRYNFTSHWTPSEMDKLKPTPRTPMYDHDLPDDASRRKKNCVLHGKGALKNQKRVLMKMAKQTRMIGNCCGKLLEM